MKKMNHSIKQARTFFEKYYAIQYNEVLSNLIFSNYEEKVKYFEQNAPFSWLNAYKDFVKHQTAVDRIELSGYIFMFDDTMELINRGLLTQRKIRAARVVAVYGYSQKSKVKRNTSRMQGYLGKSSVVFNHFGKNYDKGHFISVAGGGSTEVNLFPQLMQLNRGWSEQGKTYRQMEKYCVSHPGTFMFSRPIYIDKTARPGLIEYGYFNNEGKLIAEVFDNLN